MKVGRITIDAVSDGSLQAPPTALYGKSLQGGSTGEDWKPHRQFLDDNGMLTFEMGGFLVRDGPRTILVDAGIGPHADPSRTGSFMRSLAALGVDPGDVTDVAFTHLHFDHVGWASDGDKPLFPNATYRCHQDDWDFFVGPEAFDDSIGVQLMGGQRAIELLPALAD
ncbi:MAG: MBL fold metallo-hydrolase, partial [Nitrososphaerales archaeon]